MSFFTSKHQQQENFLGFDSDVTEVVPPPAKLGTTEPRTLILTRRERLRSRIAMSTATLSNAPATQLTFPWAMPQAEQASTIIAESVDQPVARVDFAPQREVAVGAQVEEDVAPSLREALDGDRIGKPFRVGSVMFRLLKSYGITDEEIAEGIASYTAKYRRKHAS